MTALKKMEKQLELSYEKLEMFVFLIFVAFRSIYKEAQQKVFAFIQSLFL